jgi:hypothetical protein
VTEPVDESADDSDVVFRGEVTLRQAAGCIGDPSAEIGDSVAAAEVVSGEGIQDLLPRDDSVSATRIRAHGPDVDQSSQRLVSSGWSNRCNISDLADTVPVSLSIQRGVRQTISKFFIASCSQVSYKHGSLDLYLPGSRILPDPRMKW